MLELNDMAVFAKVVERRSFTAAAHALGLPKSTVSRRVAALEERLGARLLHRTTRRIAPTDVGAAYFERCARIVADAEEADRAVGCLQQVPSGRLRITAPALVGDVWLGDVLAAYARDNPDVTLDVLFTDRVVDIVEEGFDLAVRAAARLRDSSLIARHLGEEPVVFVASPAYLEARGTPAHPDDLPRHACIVFGTGGAPPAWTFHGPEGPRRVPVAAPRALANSFVVARDLARAGLGVAMMPAFVCAADLRAGRLVRVLQAWTPPPGGIWAVYPSSRHLSAKVRTFLDVLVTAFAARAPWDVGPLYGDLDAALSGGGGPPPAQAAGAGAGSEAGAGDGRERSARRRSTSGQPARKTTQSAGKASPRTR